MLIEGLPCSYSPSSSNFQKFSTLNFLIAQDETDTLMFHGAKETQQQKQMTQFRGTKPDKFSCLVAASTIALPCMASSDYSCGQPISFCFFVLFLLTTNAYKSTTVRTEALPCFFD